MDEAPAPVRLDRPVSPSADPMPRPMARSALGMAADPRVRRLERSDIPQVCDLFALTFRPGRKVRREDVEACLARTYLSAPGDLIRPASLVDVGPAGEINGFMGIVTLAARFGDRPMRGGILGNFMATEGQRARAALRLSRATVAHDLDFLFSDTANRTSLDLSCAFGFETVPLHSLAWIKLLRPCETASFMAGRSLPMVGASLAPLARWGDRLAGRLAFVSLPEPAERGLADRPVMPSAFAAQARALVERFRFRPDWRDDEFSWLFDQAKLKSRNGTLQAREVLDRKGRTIGLYLLYARRGGVAQALQVLSEPRCEGGVLGALIRHAAAIGAVAIKGQASPGLVNGLIRQPGIVYHHAAAAIAFSRHPELRETFLSDGAFLGGLMGESWTRLMADEFA